MTATAQPRSGPRHNLPDALSTFVGRDREVSDLADLVGRSRLLTLLGAGGVGKTRLALVLARHVLTQYPGGVWIVELAPLADASLLHQAVASSVDVQEQPGRPLFATLVDSLAAENTLLVLDNCEHLVSGCAELAEQLLRACPRLSILATSREPLGVVGEVTWRVPSLTVPEAQPETTEQLSQYEAIRLFVDRAAAVQPSFRLTAHNAPAVLELCRGVDGIALAIELAAPWVRVLSPEQIRTRMTDALRLLVGGSRTAPPRQQTLRAAIEWSYGLLGEPERRLFQCLGVFAGGWTLEAAEAVCADDTLPVEDVLGLLANLVDKSLVIAELQDDSGAVRYRLLELIRAYSLEHAKQTGDLGRLQLRHRDWCLSLAERVPAEMLDADHIAELEREQDNLRAALRWTITYGATHAGMRLGAAMWPMWYVRGHYAEGRAWVAELLDLADGNSITPGRARAVAVAGHLAYCQGDHAAAEVLLRTAESIASQTGDDQTLAVVLQFLGNLARGQGDLGSARDLYAAGRELNRQLKNPVWEAMCLVGQGQAAADQGSGAEAERFAMESLALCRTAGHTWGTARSLWILGRVASERREFAQAQQALHDCITLQRQIGDRQGLVWARLDLALVAVRAGDLSLTIECLSAGLALARELGDRLSIAKAVDGIATLATDDPPVTSVRLAAAASTLRAAMGATQGPTRWAPLQTVLGAARRALGASAYEGAWASGCALSVDQTIDDSLKVLRDARRTAEMVASSAAPSSQPLTRREREVARLLTEGLTDRQIAERLVITEGTAGVHVAHILAKLGFHSRAQIAAWVVEQRLQST